MFGICYAEYIVSNADRQLLLDTAETVLRPVRASAVQNISKEVYVYETSHHRFPHTY